MSIGTLETVNDKQILTGSSGISGKDFAEAKLGVENKKKTNLETDIETNDKKLTAYSTYSNLLKSMKAKTKSLIGDHSFNFLNKLNVFDTFVTKISTNNELVSPASNYLKISQNDIKVIGKHSLQINNLAIAKEQTYINFPSTSTDIVTGAPGFFTAGTFQINNEDIVINSGDNLKTIIGKINDKSDITNVVASSLKISSNNYTMRLRSLNPGIENAYNITDNNNVLSQLSSNNLINSEDAEIIFNNQLISRPTNHIDDIITDSTFKIDLLAETNGNIINIETSRDLDSIQNQIISFMDAYNEIMKFSFKQQEYDYDNLKYKDTAILGKEIEFNSSISQIIQLINSKVSGLENNAKSTLGEIGIAMINYEGTSEEDTTIKNALTFRNNDITQFRDSLENNFDEVQKIFTFDFNSSNEKLYLVKKSNKITANNFTIDIDLSRANTDINGYLVQDKVRFIYNSQTFRPNYYPDSKRIEGLPGTPFEKMELYYTGDSVANIDVSLSQGIANLVYNFLSETLESETKIPKNIGTQTKYDANGNLEFSYVKSGLINLATNKLTDENTNKKNTLKSLEEQIETKRMRYISEHAKNEAMIRKLNEQTKSINDRFNAQYNKK